MPEPEDNAATADAAVEAPESPSLADEGAAALATDESAARPATPQPPAPPPDSPPTDAPVILVLLPNPLTRRELVHGLRERGCHGVEIARLADLLEPGARPGYWRLRGDLRRLHPRVLIAHGGILAVSRDLLARWLQTDPCARQLAIIIVTKLSAEKLGLPTSRSLLRHPDPPEPERLFTEVDHLCGRGSLRNRLHNARDLWINCQTLLELSLDLGKRHELPVSLLVGRLECPTLPERTPELRDWLVRQLRARMRKTDLILPIARQECLVIMMGTDSEGAALALARLAPGEDWECQTAPPGMAVNWSAVTYPEAGETREALYQALDEGAANPAAQWDFAPRSEAPPATEAPAAPTAAAA